MAANLPSGGPAYPLATPGVRLQLNPTENISLLGAVFAGDPAGKDCYTTGAGDPQLCNKHGTTFSLDGGAFWLGEAQYNVNQGQGRHRARRLLQDRRLVSYRQPLSPISTGLR